MPRSRLASGRAFESPPVSTGCGLVGLRQGVLAQTRPGTASFTQISHSTVIHSIGRTASILSPHVQCALKVPEFAHPLHSARGFPGARFPLTTGDASTRSGRPLRLHALALSHSDSHPTLGITSPRRIGVSRSPTVRPFAVAPRRRPVRLLDRRSSNPSSPFQAQKKYPRVRRTLLTLHCTTARFTSRALDHNSFAVVCRSPCRFRLI